MIEEEQIMNESEDIKLSITTNGELLVTVVNSYGCQLVTIPHHTLLNLADTAESMVNKNLGDGE
jgi:hypothetical protein